MVTWVRFMSPDTMYVVLGDVPFSHEPQSSQKTLFPPISLVLTLCELSKIRRGRLPLSLLELLLSHQCLDLAKVLRLQQNA